MSERRNYRKYDKEFKKNAVDLVIEGGRSVPDVAKSLGIHENLLYRWKDKYLKDKDNAFPGKGHLTPKDEEMMRLKKENANIKLERDILKKALAVFSRDEK